MTIEVRTHTIDARLVKIPGAGCQSRKTGPGLHLSVCAFWVQARGLLHAGAQALSHCAATFKLQSLDYRDSEHYCAVVASTSFYHSTNFISLSEFSPVLGSTQYRRPYLPTHCRLAPAWCIARLFRPPGWLATYLDLRSTPRHLFCNTTTIIASPSRISPPLKKKIRNRLLMSLRCFLSSGHGNASAACQRQEESKSL